MKSREWFEDQFSPITNPLNAMFGDSIFEWWHTGGGCTAVQGFLEGDITVTITDDPDTTHGEEATITGMCDRKATKGGDAAYGYVVGVYTDEGCELLSMDRCATADVLPILVARLLIEAMQTRWRFTPPLHADITDPERRTK